VMSRASKRTRKRVKEFCLIHQGLFQKVLYLFKKVLDELLRLEDDEGALGGICQQTTLLNSPVCESMTNPCTWMS
jgi:hypothetical protein